MEGALMSNDLDVLLRVLNAGGNVAVAVILWVSAKYLSEQLNTAYRRITEAHESTVRILVEVVGENTRALTRMRDTMQDMANTVDRCNTGPKQRKPDDPTRPDVSSG